MEQAISDLTSWYWWFSIVVMGIAINLCSSYLKPYADRLIESRIDKRRLKREAKDKAFMTDVKKLVDNPNLLIIKGQQAQELLQIKAFVFLIGFVCVSFLSWVGGLASSEWLKLLGSLIGFVMFISSLVVSFIVSRREHELSDRIFEARKQYQRLLDNLEKETNSENSDSSRAA